MRQLLHDLWDGEPTLILALIRALVVVGISFAANLSKEQMAALYGITEAITAVYNRQRVTPV